MLYYLTIRITIGMIGVIMEKNNNNGFTLMELLAVVLVLGIVLAIAVPRIVTTLNTASKDVFARDTESILRGVIAAAINDTTFDPTTITKDNLGTYLKTNTSNYSSIKFYYDQNNELEVVIEGSNKFEGLTAFGRLGTISVTLDEDYLTFPKLATGMIPVYYDSVDSKWKKADISNINKNWFDYINFKWANAVTVTSANRTTHLNAAVGTEIPMTDINTMFVWIPRYRYLIPAGSGPREIQIQFESKFDTKAMGDAVTTYRTHPGFTFGTQELSGLWVGKFETAGTTSAIVIKPNEGNFKTQPIKVMFESIKSLMQGSSTYGFDNNSDVHMMKNVEWGAVAYLSHSKYGKYGNASYAIKEIFSNNSASFITGRSMGAVGGSGVLTPTRPYIAEGYYTYDGKCASIYTGIVGCATGSIGQTVTDKNLSYGASTTGTIYGIYDAAGGGDEWVMAMYKPTPVPGLKDCSGYSSVYASSCPYPNSGPYSGQYNLLSIDSKYYDIYTTTNATTACNGGACLGHALSETSGWYTDTAGFVSTESPWFTRGGFINSSTATGIFAFNADNGGAYGSSTMRTVIAPQQ